MRSITKPQRHNKKKNDSPQRIKAMTAEEHTSLAIDSRIELIKALIPLGLDGIPVEEFIRQNADPVWLHQNEMWELIDENDWC